MTVVNIVPGPENLGQVSVVPGIDSHSNINMIPMPGKNGRDPQDIGIYTNNDLTIGGIENITVVDSFSITDFRMAKYMLSISKADSNLYYATEFTILIDGTNVNVSEYGMIDNDGDIGTVSVSKNGSSVEVKVTPNQSVKPVTVRFVRIGLKA